MSLPYRLLTLAEDDIVGAWNWYEGQVPGLGERFVEAVRATIESIADWPGSGAPLTHDAEGTAVERRAATTGFPYTVRYRVIDGTVVVMAVHHQRRHPDLGAGRKP